MSRVRRGPLLNNARHHVLQPVQHADQIKTSQSDRKKKGFKAVASVHETAPGAVVPPAAAAAGGYVDDGKQWCFVSALLQLVSARFLAWPARETHARQAEFGTTLC